MVFTCFFSRAKRGTRSTSSHVSVLHVWKFRFRTRAAIARVWRTLINNSLNCSF